MFAVLTCLARDHDYRLVAVAAVICLVSAVTCLSAHQRAQAATGELRLVLIGLTALVAASGVWSTHFLAMLAYQPGLVVRYDLGLTGLSLLVALGGFCLGFATACRRPTLGFRLAGGAIVGASVAAMHFTGVAAMRLPAILVWDPVLVGAALVIAATFAAAALGVGDTLRDHRRLAGAAALLVVAICGLHFTAMGAVTLLPDPSAMPPPGAIGRPVLALQAGFFVALILLAAGALLALDRYISRATLVNLKSALDQAPSAIAFFDSRHRLFFWNAPYANLVSAYGVKAEVGLAFQAILDRAGDRGLPEHARRAVDAEEARDGIVREFALPDGRWVRAEVGPTGDGGFSTVMFDVTDQRLAAAHQAAARQDAEAASRAKSEFLANMSHEIRTPLNAVLGMTQVMERHPLEDDQKARLEVIRSSGESLLGLLNSILDISKIESGKLELECQPFDLAEVLAGPCGACAALAAQKELGFSLDIDEAARGAWAGDAARLGQIVSNLLSNALKFTAGGEIRVAALVGEAGGLRIEVADTGVGVAADQLERIFDPFAQADSSTTRRFGGTGLGLTICRNLAQLMGGRLWGTSREGQGSTFVVEIPIARADAAAAAGRPPTPDLDAPPPALRILAAEDNPTNRLILAALLEPLGAELVLAEDGVEALDAWRRGGFDVILMDAQMPRMNGVEATRAIRQMEAERGLPATPILALTANVMSHQVAEYLQAGMTGHVAKPIHAESLFAAIDAVLPHGVETLAAA